MAISTTHGEIKFGVGDTVRVTTRIKEGDKERLQAYEGIVIKIKGSGEERSFTVRRVGAQKIGIERIFPINTPTIEKVEVVRKGQRGVRRAKLYYIRDKSNREIEKIYTRAARREEAKLKSKPKPKPKKKSPAKKTSRKK